MTHAVAVMICHVIGRGERGKSGGGGEGKQEEERENEDKTMWRTEHFSPLTLL